MVLRFYSQTISHASRTVAAGIGVVGLMLIGLGGLIAAYPRVFAYVVAAVFVVVGLGCAGVALRVFLSTRKLAKTPTESDGLRSTNVRIRPPYA